MPRFPLLPLLLCMTPLASQAAETTLWGDHTDASLGLLAGAVSRYLGSADYRPQLLPIVVIQRGLLFADTTRGLGLQWQSPQGLSLSGALNYDMGRDDRDNAWRPGADRLAGMGEVDGATVFDLTVSQPLAPWLSVNAEGEWRLAGARRGNRYRLGLEAIGFHDDRDTLALDLNAHAGDGRFNQTYFGVTPTQSAASGFATAHPGRGLYAYSAALNWLHSFDPRWSSVATLTTTRYGNEVHDSPLLQRRTATTAQFALTYSF